MPSLWARITGKDKKGQFPEQQGVSLGRVGDFTVIHPYGLYADLPDNTLLRIVAPGIAIPVTVDRPDDLKQGEPVFFHPATNARIIARNNGDLELIPGAGGKVKVSGDLEVSGDTALSAVVTSDGQDISGTHTHGGVATGGGTSGAPNS
jgi:hypothetical protein